MNGSESSKIGDIVLIIVGGLSILGGGATAYMSYSETEELTTQNVAQEDKIASSAKILREASEKTQRISTLIGWVGEGGYGDELLSTRALNQQAEYITKKYASWVPADKAATLQKRWKVGVDDKGVIDYDQVLEPGPTAKDIIAVLKEITKKLKEDADSKRSSRDGARQKEAEVIGADGKGGKLAEDATKWTGDNEKVVQDIKSTSERIVSNQADKMRQIATLESNIADAADQMTATRLENEAKIIELRKKANELKDRVAKLEAKGEEVEKTWEWDGTVLSVDLDMFTLYADIGKKSGVFKGTNFEIFGVDKGGKRMKKGTGEVVEVLDDMCKLAILQMLDPRVMPIGHGDRLYSDLFDAGKTKLFVFAGYFTDKYGTNDAAKLIEERGGRVQDQVSFGTSYCVIGEGFQKHPNYLRAKELGVVIIREKELYDLLGIR
ncbi:MAG: BRCT domain-containing protein [Planctomycetota bacterium]|nr:BRCT domain-containing protein [Planctomycetota bacterium]